MSEDNKILKINQDALWLIETSPVPIGGLTLIKDKTHGSYKPLDGKKIADTLEIERVQKNLLYLSFYGQRFKSGTFEYVVQALEDGPLEELDLDECLLSHADLNALFLTFPHLPKLKTLRLGNSLPDLKSMHALMKNILLLKSLTNINFSGSTIFVEFNGRLDEQQFDECMKLYEDIKTKYKVDNPCLTKSDIEAITDNQDDEDSDGEY